MPWAVSSRSRVLHHRGRGGEVLFVAGPFVIGLRLGVGALREPGDEDQRAAGGGEARSLRGDLQFVPQMDGGFVRSVVPQDVRPPWFGDAVNLARIVKRRPAGGPDGLQDDVAIAFHHIRRNRPRGVGVAEDFFGTAGADDGFDCRWVYVVEHACVLGPEQ